jgi:hypothetical protein
VDGFSKRTYDSFVPPRRRRTIDSLDCWINEEEVQHDQSEEQEGGECRAIV